MGIPWFPMDCHELSWIPKVVSKLQQIQIYLLMCGWILDQNLIFDILCHGSILFALRVCFFPMVRHHRQYDNIIFGENEVPPE